MDDFLKKVVEGHGVSPPEECHQSFKQNFEEAINVEWFKKESCYEAIFYKNNLEHIALFDISGVLLEYRQNLSEDHLPIAIKDLVTSRGELMNSVLKNKGNMLEYEIILRDRDLNRYLITISEIGTIIQEMKL